MSIAYLALDKDSPTSLEFMKLKAEGKNHLVPTGNEIAAKQMDLIYDYLVYGQSDSEHAKIFMMLAAKTESKMTEWLRVQMHNLKVTDEIKNGS